MLEAVSSVLEIRTLEAGAYQLNVTVLNSGDEIGLGLVNVGHCWIFVVLASIPRLRRPRRMILETIKCWAKGNAPVASACENDGASLQDRQLCGRLSLEVARRAPATGQSATQK